MKLFKKFVVMFAIVIMLGLSSTLLFACGSDNTKDRLSIYQEFKTEYYVGDTLDVSRGILKYIDGENKVQYVTLKQEMVDIDSFSTDLPGTWSMVITYEDETLLVSYTVKAYDVKDGVYYKVDFGAHSQDQNKNTYLEFDLEHNVLKQYSSDGAPSQAEYSNMYFDIERIETEQHFIEYTGVLRGLDAPVPTRIYEIGKNSFKITQQLPGAPAITYTCYEYVAQ